MSRSAIIPDYKDINGNWVQSYSVSGFQYFTRGYILWQSVNARCKKSGYIQNTSDVYRGVKNGFKDFQEFAGWCNEQHGYMIKEGSGKYWQLDKDLLSGGAREYNSENCLFVPNYINGLLNTQAKKERTLALGVTAWSKGRFRPQIQDGPNKKHLGLFNSEIEAHRVYQNAKLDVIQNIINKDFDYLGSKIVDVLIKCADKLKNDIETGSITTVGWAYK